MSGSWNERNAGGRRGDQGGALALGIILVIVGLAFMVGQQFTINLGEHGWPVFVIVPGVILLLIGLAVPHEGGLGAAIPGGIITTVGLVLAYQTATNAYATWAYAWALIAPGSVGVTLTLYGLLHRRLDLFDAGLRTAAVGLGLFVGFGLLFENVIGLDAGGASAPVKNAFPLLAMGLGVFIVILNLIPRRAERVEADAWTQVDSPNSPLPPAPPASPAG
jgi:hypothetical protein